MNHTEDFCENTTRDSSLACSPTHQEFLQLTLQHPGWAVSSSSLAMGKWWGGTKLEKKGVWGGLWHWARSYREVTCPGYTQLPCRSHVGSWAGNWGQSLGFLGLEGSEGQKYSHGLGFRGEPKDFSCGLCHLRRGGEETATLWRVCCHATISNESKAHNISVDHRKLWIAGNFCHPSAQATSSEANCTVQPSRSTLDAVCTGLTNHLRGHLMGAVVCLFPHTAVCSCFSHSLFWS